MNETKNHLARALAVLLVSFASAGPASAAELVAPGTVVLLGSDEGLLVVGVELRDEIDSLAIDQPGRLLWTHTFRDLKPGHNVRVLRVRAGTYRWRQVTIGDFRIGLGDRRRWVPLEVEAGKINYSGDLIYDELPWQRVYTHRANRVSQILATLETRYAGLLNSLPFAYHGASPDPYVDFRRQETQGQNSVSHRPAVDQTVPTVATSLFLAPRFSQMRMNPQGTLVAVKVRDTDRPGNYALWVIEAATGRTVEVFRASAHYDQHIGSFEWGGDETLIVTVHPGWTDRRTHIVRLRRPDGQLGAGFERFFIQRPGSLVDPLPRDDRHILYARYAKDGLGNVYRLDVSDADAIDRQFRSRYRIVKNLQPMLAWLADPEGQIRLAMGPGDNQDEWVLRFRDTVDTPWRAVWQGGADDIVEPVAFGHTQDTVIVLSAQDRDKRAVVELNTRTGQLGTIIYEDPDVDVTGVVTDPAGRGILGVHYYRGGELDVHHLEQRSHSYQESLEQTFPGRSVLLVDISEDTRKALVHVSGPAEPGRYYLFDSVDWSARLITSVAPWTNDMALRPTELLQLETRDGLRVEGYLTLPDIDGNAPLVVMPHGGPIGVRDVRMFDPAVQFLAGRGYAVLQVNYRGSSGFGKAFEAAGRGEWGRAIEDDIEAMMDLAFERYALDANRTCIYGSSYGGYSALMSVIRSPRRFRCAASYAGVTDLMLLFDRDLTAAGRANLVDVLGDPAIDRQRLIATSPLYQYERITRPVFLSHGTEDAHVDIEHLYRLETLLTRTGRSVETLILDGERHGITDADNQAVFFSRLDRFLARHLGPTRPAANSPD